MKGEFEMPEEKKEPYIAIFQYMRTELNLTGNELLTYAIINGFTRLEAGKFTGSAQYIADWVGCTRQCTMKNLTSLVEKGLIVKQEIMTRYGKRCEYSTVPIEEIKEKKGDEGVNSVDRGCKNSLQPGVNSVDRGCKNSLQPGVNSVDRGCKNSLQPGVNSVDRGCKLSSHKSIDDSIEKNTTEQLETLTKKETFFAQSDVNPSLMSQNQFPPALVNESLECATIFPDGTVETEPMTDIDISTQELYELFDDASPLSDNKAFATKGEEQETFGFIQDTSITKDEQKPKPKPKKKKNKTKTDILAEMNVPRQLGEEPFIGILLNDGTEFQIYESLIEHWKKLYPAVNVYQELRNMCGWSLSNPSKRKTERGIHRFITSWLQREQDRGGRKNYGNYGQNYNSGGQTGETDEEVEPVYFPEGYWNDWFTKGKNAENQ